MILKRRVGESVLIGTGEKMVTVKVLKLGDAAVSLGVSAPAEIQVDRDELRRDKEEWEKLRGGES